MVKGLGRLAQATVRQANQAARPRRRATQATGARARQLWSRRLKRAHTLCRTIHPMPAKRRHGLSDRPAAYETLRPDYEPAAVEAVASLLRLVVS